MEYKISIIQQNDDYIRHSTTSGRINRRNKYRRYGETYPNHPNTQNRLRGKYNNNSYRCRCGDINCSSLDATSVPVNSLWGKPTRTSGGISNYNYQDSTNNTTEKCKKHLHLPQHSMQWSMRYKQVGHPLRGTTFRSSYPTS